MLEKLTDSFKSLIRRIKDTYVGYKCNKIADALPTDINIQYPSYKSMDEFIDIEKLKSLDIVLTTAITEYLKNPPNDDYFKNPFTPKDNFFVAFTERFWQPKIIDSHVIFLAKHIDKYNYFDISDPTKWEFTPFTEQIPEVMSFIKTLPFKATSRIMLMFDTGEHAISPHRDHFYPDICQEFIWFRTNLKKKFYFSSAGNKEYISSYSAWFDTVNQFHGAEAAGELNFSIRVDGIFNDDLRKLIPKPSINVASTPSLWATLDSEKQSLM